jgi:thiol-disulfide isomerase/thioredoxin
MRTVALTAALVLAAGCKQDKPAEPAKPPEVCTGAVAHGPLAWFEDDYPAALACARATSRPLVVDMWAPWCHTCISMQTTVLQDASLKPFADRFVYVAIDTDREPNAAVVARYPLQNWPTFFVVAPGDEAVQERWLGAASIEQFRTLLKDGEAAYLAHTAGSALDPLMALVRDGNQAAVKKDWKAAAAAWQQAIARAPEGWPRRSDVLVSLISALWKGGDVAGCVELALSHGQQTGSTANATDFIVWSLQCAGDKSADPATAEAVRRLAVERLTPLIDDAAAPLSIDDRSDAMMNLREALAALGQPDAAKAMAERQLTFLADAAAAAPDAWAASTYNWPRAEVHVWLQRGPELVTALEKSAADLPREYDPPYRLAWVLMKSGEPARALPWAERAVTLAYGARKVRLQGLLIEVHKATGDAAGERAARAALVKILETLPPEQAQPEALAKARAELEASSPAAPPPT